MIRLSLEAKLKSNVWKLYSYWFFHNLILAYVIEVLYWQDRGMTVQMMVYAGTIYAVIVILLEIPTGVLADRWSRKNLLVVGAALSCAEFAILIFARSFWHFALAVALARYKKPCVAEAATPSSTTLFQWSMRWTPLSAPWAESGSLITERQYWRLCWEPWLPPGQGLRPPTGCPWEAC